MDIQAFKEQYEKDEPILHAWGKFVTEEIQKQLASKLTGSITIGTFLKIPPSPRTKTIDSLVAKAFYRGKSYRDPYRQITDKVGTRFVVLLLKDIRLIQSIVEGSDKWTFSKDRDFEEERRKNPLSFDYQSVLTFGSSKHTPCRKAASGKGFRTKGKNGVCLLLLGRFGQCRYA